MSEVAQPNGHETDAKVARKKGTDSPSSDFSPMFQMPQSTTDQRRSNGNLASILQRKHNLNFAPRSIMRMRNNQVIQSSLTVNSPGDSYEREADSVAAQVMSGGHDSSGGISQFATPNISRLQASGLSEGGFEAPAEVESRIQRMQGGGNALPTSEVNFFAQRMGYDFSGVRVHTDSNAVQASRDIQAKAFTVGNNIAFGDGAYQPGTSAGRHLLAHELTHVVQQGQATKAPVQRKPANIQRDDNGTWSWTRAEGEDLDRQNLDGVEIEEFSQAFLGLFDTKRAMLYYTGSAAKSVSATDATLNIRAWGQFNHFTSIGRFIATGWQTDIANMSQAERQQIDPTSGSITTGLTPAAVDEHPVNGPLTVTAGITKRVEDVNSTHKKLIISVDTKAVVGGQVTETVGGGVSAGASAGGHEGAPAGEIGAEASTSWSIAFNGGHSVDIFRANYIFHAEKTGGTTGGAPTAPGGRP